MSKSNALSMVAIGVASAAGGGSGTSNYNNLTNKPKINNVELSGNKTASDLGINVPTKTSELTNDSGFLTEHQSLANYSTTTEMNTAINAHHDSSKQDTLSSDPAVGNVIAPLYVDTGELRIELGNGVHKTSDDALEVEVKENGGITLDANGISVDTTAIQEKLTAGDNITITNNVISASASAPSNMVTTDTAQTINAVKTLTANTILSGFGGTVKLDNKTILDASNGYTNIGNKDAAYGTRIVSKIRPQWSTNSGPGTDLATTDQIPTVVANPSTTTDTLTGITIGDTSYAVSGGGSSYTFTDGLTESSGTVSWDLNDRVGAVGTRSIQVGSQSNSDRVSATNSIVSGYVGSSSTISSDYSIISSSGTVSAAGTGNLISLSSGTVNGRGLSVLGADINAYTDTSSANPSIVGGNDIAFGKSNMQQNSGNAVFGNHLTFGDTKQCSGSFMTGGSGGGDKTYSKMNANYASSLGFNLKTSSDYQHVIGKSNIEDASDTYAFIIGNGTGNSARSNALTVDWDGNVVCNNIPAHPSTAGTYNLQVVVDSEGNPTYSWVAQS